MLLYFLFLYFFLDLNIGRMHADGREMSASEPGTVQEERDFKCVWYAPSPN